MSKSASDGIMPFNKDIIAIILYTERVSDCRFSATKFCYIITCKQVSDNTDGEKVCGETSVNKPRYAAITTGRLNSVGRG